VSVNPRPTAFPQLRSARTEDLPRAEALLQKCKLARNEVHRQFGPNFTLAEADDGSLVGAAGVELYGRQGLLRSVAVDPAWRGRRIGETLARDRLDWAHAQGLTALYLLTETAADYWLRFGFHRIARDAAPPEVRGSPEWSGGCPETAVAMVLVF